MKIRKLAKKYICFFSALSMIIPCFEVKAQGGMKADINIGITVNGLSDTVREWM